MIDIKKKTKETVGPMPGKEVFGHISYIESVKIQVILSSTGYLSISSSFDAFIHFEAYSIDSSKMIGNSPAEVSGFDRLFLKLNRFICN